jgi:hypothetical protein
MTRTRAGSEGCEPFAATTAEMKPKGQTPEARKGVDFSSRKVARGGDAVGFEHESTKRVGPAALSNAALFRACRARHKPWIQSRKCFVEAFERAKQRRIPGVRTQADLCRLIGCSVRWAQLILAGTAVDSNKHKANKLHRALDPVTAKSKRDEDYANDIARYAQCKLQVLMAQEWKRYQDICGLLERYFAEQSNAEEK